MIPAHELWFDNARVLLLTFAAAAAVTWWPKRRVLVDVAIGTLLGANILIVALALGAYGSPLLQLAPAHYALELLAIAAATAAYVHARRHHRLDMRVIAPCAIAAAALLAAGAILESAAS